MKRSRLVEVMRNLINNAIKFMGGNPRRALTLARRIIEVHDGRIQAEPELGNGATFLLALPWHNLD